ncbi:uncharacterized protein K452DRAFT_328769 [Aplosporella prunicola CBS 121167]|uniref:Uncharacterized protein n=1 Tax=Aplosporella prunicola CBS 121167 TaxID=1176127 RepID=A0A6A6B344_9PEZI|nr:uncharacterized protein K452DRAFT_328769 [Aplosporella prunicola CBS 121167]KAF2138609.1 hypothetical protein K452DRAFT_328769 [Aplosporella prunicola CBS 121167]
MRRLFGFGRKKDHQDKDNAKKPSASSAAQAQGHGLVAPAATTTPNKLSSARPVSPATSPPADSRAQLVSTPQSSPRVYASSAASPDARYRSSSPRLHSPASSQIFERNVQESSVSGGELSPAIPSHIQTEDHIPPVLEASAQAITDDHLNPDEVEIVMHSAHQPAVHSIAASTASTEAVNSPTIDEVASHHETDDGASNYGALDKDDIRRLSFISFADVVQAEHAETGGGGRDSMHHTSVSNRSPSPVRSPASSRGGMGTSPPTSGAPSIKGGADPSSKRPPASPTASQGACSPPTSSSGGGELMVETMRQALRKTGSGDLSTARSPSQPLSAVSADDADCLPFR